MQTGAPSNTPLKTSSSEASQQTAEGFDLPDGYTQLRSSNEIQFTPLELEPIPPSEPSWFLRMLGDVLAWLGDLLAPLLSIMEGNWIILFWICMAALAAYLGYLIIRQIRPRPVQKPDEQAEPEWRPDHEESLALLEDADALAAQGRFDEATRLLLQRSVGQIAASRPEWVDPSSTARELAALPRLSEAARQAFRVISEAVERSLFALKQLSREDWESARAAYAKFALARIDAGKPAIDHESAKR